MSAPLKWAAAERNDPRSVFGGEKTAANARRKSGRKTQKDMLNLIIVGRWTSLDLSYGQRLSICFHNSGMIGDAEEPIMEVS